MRSAIFAATFLAASLFAVSAGPAIAQQEYPNKPIRIIIPFPPGGTNDALARLIGPKLTESWGQQVLVDNRAGGNSVIGTAALAKAQPDGYTLIVVSNAHVIVPSVLSAPYDPIKDFTPVATMSSTEQFLVVNPSLPVKNLQDVIALAKAKPGQLNGASAGSGTVNHIALEIFNDLAGVKIQHVPYKGSGPALGDLMGGQVQLSFVSTILVLGHVRSGKLNAIAVSGEKRVPAVPQVPTFTEGGLPGFDVKTWYGFLAPADTPKAIVDKLSAEIGKILLMPDFKEKLVSQGMEPFFVPTEQYGALLRSDMARYAKIIKAGNIKMQ